MDCTSGKSVIVGKTGTKGEVLPVLKIMVSKYNNDGNLTSKWEKNYQPRLDLVRDLLAIYKVSSNVKKEIWLANLFDFFRLDFMTNKREHYLAMFKAAMVLSSMRMLATIYFPLAAYRFLLSTFQPIADLCRSK
jgi:hypothetical protein